MVLIPLLEARKLHSCAVCGWRRPFIDIWELPDWYVQTLTYPGHSKEDCIRMEAERRENREYLAMFGEDEDVKSPRTLRALDRVKRSAKRVAADAAYQRAVETKMRSLMRAQDFDVENLTYSELRERRAMADCDFDCLWCEKELEALIQ